MVRIARVAQIFCLLGLLIGAIGAASAEPLKIRMSWVITPNELAPLLFAHPGLAKHEGISYTVEPIHFAGGPLSIPAIAKGEIDIGGLGYATIAAAIQGAGIDDLTVIGDVQQDGVPGWYSAEYMVLIDGPIHSIDDLRGKTLGVNTIGSLIDLGQRQMLRQHNIDDRKDLTIIEVASPNMKATLNAHKVDMVGVVAAIGADPELRAAARPLFTIADSVGVTQISALVARGSFIKEHRAALVDLLEDTIRITRWYTDPANHDAAVKIVADFSKQSIERAAWVFTRQDQFRSPDVVPDIDALQRNVDLLYKLGFIKSRLDIGPHVDLSLVREADMRLH